jgi:hypothetical protein
MDKKTITLIIILALILIIGLWFTNLLILRCYSPLERSSYGDMFGVVNSLFSGLAFGGIVLTIYLQHRELNETREVFIKQNNTIALQRFENTLFNLLSVHHNIVNNIDYSFLPINYDLGKAFELKGRDVFKESYRRLVSKLRIMNTIEEINIAYLKEYENYNTDFGHYFRNLYRIFKLIDEMSLVPPEELFKTRYNYTSIVRAQLSDYELLWLAYNCVSDKGKERFKPLVHRYTLLNNIDKERIPNRAVREELYPTAFKLDEKYYKLVHPLG